MISPSPPARATSKIVELRRSNAQLPTTALPVMIEFYGEERWAPVAGFEGLYEVSTFGRVRSTERVIELVDHPTLKRRTIKARILAQQTNMPSRMHNYRRLQVKLWKENRERTFNVARLVAEAFLPNPHNMPLVLHQDDDATNNRVENLQWGDHAENVRQAVERGRFPSGQRHHAYVHGRFAKG
jgi:hypothetical protein